MKEETVILPRNSFAITREVVDYLKQIKEYKYFYEAVITMFDFGLDGKPPENNFMLPSELQQEIRKRIIRYDRCVDNGKYGHLGGKYGHLGGRPPKTPKETPKENEGTPEQEHEPDINQLLHESLKNMALGHFVPTHQVMNGRYQKVRYVPPNLWHFKELTKEMEKLRTKIKQKFSP